MKNKMKNLITLLPVFFMASVFGQDGNDILKRVEANMSSENRVFESTMIIHGTRSSRTITSVTYSAGEEKSFTEYLSPPREQGTKILKLENQLWIYSPSTDRTIQISGHMLRQSVMGSDLSYEDMMDDRKLSEMYNAINTGTETVDGRKTWILDMTAKTDNVAYYKCKMWIDTERYIPLREELFAKSGQMLKQTNLSEVKQIEGRWFPLKVIYKDLLKKGKGTEFIINSIKFNQPIPEYIFTKAALKK
ncbi:MAG TPA: outer membrane lipoprotein-sorting protein [Bacteroidales bacterium]|nr:outer membrane lipoprotein-sorting protein [Bacteroidales bacterium]